MSGLVLQRVFMAFLIGGCVWGVVRQPRYVYALQRKEGTRKCHSYPKERIGFSAMPALEKIAYDPHAPVDPRVDRKSTRLNPVTNAHLVCRLLLEKKKKKNS